MKTMDGMIGKIVTGIVALVVFAVLLPVALTSLGAINYTNFTNLQPVVEALPIILAVGVLIAIIASFLYLRD